MFSASNCTCAVYFTYTAHVPLLAENMAATMYTPFAYAFAYAIKQTPYAFVAKIILCMYSMTRASKLKFHPPPPTHTKKSFLWPDSSDIKTVGVRPKKNMCFLFRPVKSLGRVGRLSALIGVLEVLHCVVSISADQTKLDSVVSCRSSTSSFD